MCSRCATCELAQQWLRLKCTEKESSSPCDALRRSLEKGRDTRVWFKQGAVSSSMLPAGGTSSRREGSAAQGWRGRSALSLWDVGAGAALLWSMWQEEPLLLPALQRTCSLPPHHHGAATQIFLCNSFFHSTTQRSSRSLHLRKLFS